MAEQILSLTEKLRPKDIGTLAGSIKSPNFKYSVLGTIFGRKTSRKDWMQLVAGIKNPTQQNSLLTLIFGNRNQRNSTQIATVQTTKLKPLEQGNEFIDGLLKIYTFMRKTHDEDVLRREEENNFKEEALLEEKRRHQKLLDSIEKLKKSMTMMAYSTQSQKLATEDAGGGITPPIITNRPGSGGRSGGKSRTSRTGNGGKNGSKKTSATKSGSGSVRIGLNNRPFDSKVQPANKPTATRMSRTLRSAKKMVKFMAKGVKALPMKFIKSAGVVAGITNVITDISDLIDKRENDEIDDKELHKGIVKAIAAATAGTVGAEVGAALGSLIMPFVGTIAGGVLGYYAGSKYGEQIGEKLFNYFDSGKEAEPQQKESSTQTPGALNDTEKAVTQAAPYATPMKTSKATGSALPTGSAKGTMSDRLRNAVSENNSAKLDTLIESPSTSTINNVADVVQDKSAVAKRASMPPVRNLEESYQKSMIYSTRVV